MSIRGAVACMNGMVAVVWARAVRTGWCGWERRDSALRLNSAVARLAASGREPATSGARLGYMVHAPYTCTLYVRTRLVRFSTLDGRAGARGVALGGRRAGAGRHHIVKWLICFSSILPEKLGHKLFCPSTPRTPLSRRGVGC